MLLLISKVIPTGKFPTHYMIIDFFNQLQEHYATPSVRIAIHYFFVHVWGRFKYIIFLQKVVVMI